MQNPKPTPGEIARLFGCTLEQAADNGLRRTAAAIRAMSNRQLALWGKTREQAETIAKDYDSRAKL
jgi:hypothetical protein